MLGNKPPYTTMQQLNLDWILSKLKTLLRLVPDDGAVGQILRRTRDGAVWSDEQGGGGGGAVESVNGQTGVVVLDAADVGALPDDYTPPVTSVNGKTGAVVLDADDVGALPDDYTPPVTSVNGQTGAVVVSVPVQSVNGKTGTVVLDATDVGALPDDYTPPVTSVNGQTGAVVIETPSDIFNKELSSRCFGKGLSSSAIDFILYLPYIDVPYNIAFTNNKVNVADIGTSTVSIIHAKDTMCVYFRVSASGVTTNRMYVAGATFTLTKV